MKNIVRWGILGPGVIAHKFAQGLLLLKDARLTAVASRSLERAEDFARKYEMEKAFGSYEELAACEDVDIVYVATPHPSHRETALLCLKAGKAVLCEKPFTVNASQLEDMILEARSSRVFLMEAMWTRFLPAMVQVREWLGKGLIGDVRMVKADFGFRSGWNPEERLLNPQLGGGALLDVGIYVVSLVSMILGPSPVKVESMAYIGKTGVDEQFSALLGYEEGKIANVSAAVRTNLPGEAWVIGTQGKIRIPAFWCAKSASLMVDGQEDVEFTSDSEGAGYHYEAQEAMNCLREGKLESSVIPLDESLEIMKLLDTIRSQWGLKYPFE